MPGISSWRTRTPFLCIDMSFPLSDPRAETVNKLHFSAYRRVEVWWIFHQPSFPSQGIELSWAELRRAVGGVLGGFCSRQIKTKTYLPFICSWLCSFVINIDKQRAGIDKAEWWGAWSGERKDLPSALRVLVFVLNALNWTLPASSLSASPAPSFFPLPVLGLRT